MKKLLLLAAATLLFVAFSYAQSVSNTQLKMEHIDGRVYITNISSAPAEIQSRVNGESLNKVTLPAGGTSVIALPVGGIVDARIKPTGNDNSWLTITIKTAQTLPVKFVSFKVVPTRIKDEFLITFEIAEATDVKAFNVQLSFDGANYQTVKIVLPDAVEPNRIYKTYFNINEQL